MRWLRHILLLLITFLWLACLGLWIRSYHRWDKSVVALRGAQSVGVWSFDGKLEFRWMLGGEYVPETHFVWGHRPQVWPISAGTINLDPTRGDEDVPDREHWVLRETVWLGESLFWEGLEGHRDPELDIAGVLIGSTPVPPGSRPLSFEPKTHKSVRVPHGYLAAPLGIAPMLWCWTHARRHWRRRRGLCLKCGYDLRASPDGCPECGEARGPR